jgi:hypothetical protein
MLMGVYRRWVRGAGIIFLSIKFLKENKGGGYILKTKCPINI